MNSCPLNRFFTEDTLSVLQLVKSVGAERETIRHVLLECTMAKVFWEHTKKLAGVKLPHLHQDTWARDLLLAKVCSRREAM